MFSIFFKKFLNWLLYTGLWIPFPLTCVLVAGSSFLFPYSVPDLKTVGEIFLCTLCIPLYIWSSNLSAKQNGVTKFPLFPTRSFRENNPDYQVSFRTKALHKDPPQILLHKEPLGIILGKCSGKYVSVIPGKEGASHTLILGGSGSGKTSNTLLSSLLASSQSSKKMADPITWILVDVKGELEQKGFFPDANLAVFNPKDRSRWGFDFFYELSCGVDESIVHNVMKRIVFSLIPLMHGSTSDSFWTDAPRSVLIGLFVYGYQYKHLHNLPDIVDFALSKNLRDLIDDILAEVNSYSIVHKYLIAFGGESTADETLGGIAMSIGNAINLLATDEDLRFLLKECENKISPPMIEDGTHISLQISDEYLEQYAPILNCILATFCNSYLARRPEGSSPVVLMIDELGRIVNASGVIQGLQALLQIGRSRGVTVMCALQSWAALDGIYTSGACKDMLANFQYRLIMQCQPDAKDITDMAVAAFGKYLERHRTINQGKQSTSSFSFEEKDVLQPSDLLDLPQKNQVVLLCPYGAFFLNRCPYFRDPKLRKLAALISQQRNSLNTTNTKEDK